MRIRFARNRVASVSGHTLGLRRRRYRQSRQSVIPLHERFEGIRVGVVFHIPGQQLVEGGLCVGDGTK